jgi:hypothetical protein
VNPFQSGSGGLTDAFVSKLGPVVNLSMTQTAATASPSPVGMGNPVTFKYTITNLGDLTTGITLTDNTAASIPASFTSATASPGTCGSATSGIVLCNIGTLNAGTTATVTIILTPTAPTTPNNTVVTLTNSATANVTGSTISASASASAMVNDFSIGVAPATTTEPAGVPSSYTVTVTPTQNSAAAFPDTVALSCSSGLPTGATCTFPNGASLANLNNGAQSRQLVINTTPRVTTPASLWHAGGLVYATLLPVSGLFLLGIGIGNMGIGKKMSRKRRGLLGLILGAFLALLLLQAGCGSSKKIPITTGTPAGTYSITVTATSGSATRTQPIQLVVQ